MTEMPDLSKPGLISNEMAGERDSDIEALLRLAQASFGKAHIFMVGEDSSMIGRTGFQEVPPQLIELGRRVASPGGDRIEIENDAERTGFSFLGTPITRQGDHRYGALCVAVPGPHDWSDTERSIVADLAALAGLASQFRETTTVLGEQLRAQQLENSVGDAMNVVAAESNRAWTIESVVAALVDNGRRAAGAELISILGKAGDEFRFYHGGGVPEDIAEGFVTMDVTEPFPMAFTCRTGTSVVLKDRESFAEWPEFEKTMLDTDIVALVSYPIFDTSGDVTAVLGLGYTSPLGSSEVPATVIRLGALMRQGLERAAAYQQERRHAAHLESMVIPQTFPTVANLELSGSYSPPTAGQRVGGDLYDVIPMPGKRAGLVVADATGHDIAASQATVQLRHGIGALSNEGRSPAHVLGGANAYLLNSNVNSLVTCAYAQIDPTSGELVVANAGHPHPRILRKDGTVEVVGVDQISQPLLGLMSVDYRETTTSLDYGDTLIMFTDGLIERRDVPLIEGEEKLRRALGTLGNATVDEIVTALENLLHQERDDDLAILVARRSNDVLAAVESSLRLSWPASDLVLADARSALRDWLHQVAPDLDALVCQDIELVATELLTNARSASTGPQDVVSFAASREDSGLWVEASNHGESFAGATEMPSAHTERGRGLPLVEALADLTIRSGDGQTVVRALFPNKPSVPENGSDE